MASPELPPKKDVMLALLERSSVFIHLDPRHDDVRVPPWFKKQPQLVLQVGLNMAVRIPDLDVGDDAVSCTLSFSRSPFFCYMPWKAVFALVAEDGKGMLWPNDIPPEVAAQQAERAKKDEARARMRPVGDAPPPQKAESAAADAPIDADRSAKARPTGKKGRVSRARTEKSGVAEAEGSDVAQAKAAKGVAQPAREPRDGPADAIKPGRPASPGPSTDREKRQLPPYLRVVK